MTKAYFLSLIAYLIFFAAYRVLISFSVYQNAKAHNLKAKRVWLIFTLLFGLVSALVYLIFEEKTQETQPKERKKSIAFAIAAFMIIPLCVIYYFTVFSTVQDKADEYDNSHFDKHYNVFFQNENGEEVIYDKMGNAYTYDNSEEFLYYDKDGKTYKTYSQKIDEYSDEYGIICNETGEKIQDGFESEQDYLIGEDGYLYIYSDDDYGKTYSIYLDPDEERSMLGAVYFSKDGKLLYEESDVFWDSEGNLVFLDDYIYKDFKYSDIPKDQLDWN